jgi:Uncharacterised nucleotidyltransferase
MRNEDLLLFQCTRQDFTPVHQEAVASLCRMGEIEWGYLFRVARFHGVAPLVYTNLQQMPAEEIRLSVPVQADFQQAVERNMRVKERMAGLLQQVLGELNAQGLDVMMVKGNALSLFVYTQEWYTSQADVDLMIRQPLEEIPPSVLKPVIQLIETINKDHPRQEHIEYDFYLHHDISMNGILRVDPARLWANARLVEHYGARFYINSPEDMLLVTCINSCRKRYFRLKSLLDITEILDHYPELDWADLAARARDYQCHSILFTALTVTRKCLGGSLPDDLHQLFFVSPTRAHLIQALVDRLYRRGTLESLAYYSQAGLLGRNFSWTLLLTYLTYPNNLLGAKFGEITRDWQRLRRNPAYRQVRPRIR